MGLLSKKQKTTTTPTIMDPMKQHIGPFSDKVGEFMASDPTKFVAPASELQTKAFGDAGGLGAWQPYAGEAMNMVRRVGEQPAARAQAFDYSAPQLGNFTRAATAQLGAAPLAQGVQLAHSRDAQASLATFRSLLDDGGIQKYMDPAVDAYVKNVMRDYDHGADQQRAQMKAQAARSGAFGGSRFGIAEGQFEADTGRNRATMESGLYRDAFGQGAQLAMHDAQRRQDVDLSNAALQTQISSANAAAANEMARAQGGLDLQRSLADQNMLGQFGLTQGQLQQQANLFDADAANLFRRTQAELDAGAAQFGAQNRTNVSLANAGFDNDLANRNLQAAGLMGDMANNYGAQQRADLGLTADLGAMQRGIASETYNALPTQLQLGANLFPPQAYIGENSVMKTGGMGTWLPQVAGSAMQAISFSDRRLKSQLRRIGSHGPLGLYSYIMGGRPSVGIVADEVAIHAPEALGPVINGFATVDYGKLGLAHLLEV